MNDVINFINNKKQVLLFNGKEYKVNPSYKITIYLESKQKEIREKSKDESFNSTEANFNLIFDIFKIAINEEFAKEVDKMDLSEDDLINLFYLINLMRKGKTQEEAIEEIEKNEGKEEEKN